MNAALPLDDETPVRPGRRAVLVRAGCVAVPLLAAVGAAVGWFLRAPLGRMVVGTTCPPVEVPQLDMIELISVRKKTTAHRVNPESPLLLSDREMSWVLSEQYHVPVEIQAQGEVVVARKPLALDGGVCGELAFTGGVAIEGGSLSVRPTSVWYGPLPLPVVPGRAVSVDPSWLGAEAPAAERVIRAIASLEVRDGTFRVHLSDMGIIP